MARSIMDFLRKPQSQLVPVDQLDFGKPIVVRPMQVPQGIGGMVFPNAQYNKAAGIPGQNAITIWSQRRTGPMSA